MTNNIVLFSTNEEALSYRKQLALKSPEACFGIMATTYSAWLDDAWELYGDGRTLVSPLDRSFAVRALLH